MLSNESTVPIGRRKLLFVVKTKLQWCHVGVQKHIWSNRACNQIRSWCYPIIYVCADIGKGEAVEATVNDMSKIVGRDVIPNVIAFIYRGPECAPDSRLKAIPTAFRNPPA